MKNKRGMELSVNMIVILIISIVILGMGISFFSKIYQTAQNYREKSEQQAQKEIENYLIKPNEKVAIPINTKEITRKGYQTFGLIINNPYSEEKTFDISTEGTICSDGVKSQQATIDVKYLNEITISPNNRGTLLIGVETKGVGKGQCVIPIKVMLNGEEYGKEVITITIE